MMHTCILCGAACYCDMEDHESPQPADCSHVCDEDEDDEDYYERQEMSAALALAEGGR